VSVVGLWLTKKKNISRRKHTGERPFSCHCGKQFSRLDNLRQHAQTVHADKQEQNERMMRDLTSLHATMAAANKAGSMRTGAGGRRPPANNNGNQSELSPSSPDGGDEEGLNLIKQEDLGGIPMHARPGTTTGYEGDHGGSMMYHHQHHQQHQRSSWHVQTDLVQTDMVQTDIDHHHHHHHHRASPRGTNHSFRDPSQSFLAPQSSSSHSFLAYPNTSRPPTSSGLTSSDPTRSLPPLSAVVSASLTSPSPPPSHSQQQQHFAVPQQPHPQQLLSFHTRRPGTAPSSHNGGAGGGMGLPPNLSGPYGRGNAFPVVVELGGGGGQYDEPSSSSPSSTGHDSSPFYFHPPPPSEGIISGSGNPRKRAFGGPDGPSSLTPGGPGGGGGTEYDYGTESRPQSRRLSVMELCNDNGGAELLLSAASQRLSSSSFAFASGGPAATGGGTGAGNGTSRPTTSSGLGLVTSASALHLSDGDRSASRSPPRAASSERAAAPAAAAASERAAPALFAGARYAAVKAGCGDGVGSPPPPPPQQQQQRGGFGGGSPHQRGGEDYTTTTGAGGGGGGGGGLHPLHHHHRQRIPSSVLSHGGGYLGSTHLAHAGLHYTSNSTGSGGSPTLSTPTSSPSPTSSTYSSVDIDIARGGGADVFGLGLGYGFGAGVPPASASGEEGGSMSLLRDEEDTHSTNTSMLDDPRSSLRGAGGNSHSGLAGDGGEGTSLPSTSTSMVDSSLMGLGKFEREREREGEVLG
jgi:hypothetical protein